MIQRPSISSVIPMTNAKPHDRDWRAFSFQGNYAQDTATTVNREWHYCNRFQNFPSGIQCLSLFIKSLSRFCNIKLFLVENAVRILNKFPRHALAWEPFLAGQRQERNVGQNSQDSRNASATAPLKQEIESQVTSEHVQAKGLQNAADCLQEMRLDFAAFRARQDSETILLRAQLQTILFEIRTLAKLKDHRRRNSANRPKSSAVRGKCLCVFSENVSPWRIHEKKKSKSARSHRVQREITRRINCKVVAKNDRYGKLGS